MLQLQDALKILNSYNINSGKYGPTIYQDNNNTGICLELKDDVFGFLTRYFTFTTPEELDTFLKEYFWYKKNKNKYNITLSLDNYDTPNPNIIYTFKNQALNIEDMQNIDSIIKDSNEEEAINITKNNYIKNIKELTNYILNIKNTKSETITLKNNLKQQENSLKDTLLEKLSTYYGKARKIEPRTHNYEQIPTNQDINALKENAETIQDKSLDDIKSYLENLINIAKEEESDDKHLVNLYSNTIYNYNIDILNKQIDFVNNKINAEKNFNLKGSKIHNIDAELKSFLNTNIPPKMDTFLTEKKNTIKENYAKITNLEDAYQTITGNLIPLEAKGEIKPISYTKNTIIKDLESKFDNLDKHTKTNLILYNSFYKPICNYIINNNYPSLEDIKSNFNFDYYYNELTDIIFNENNNHYLVTYFSILDFSNLDNYINSLINICKTLENTKFSLVSNLKTFNIEDNNLYKTLTIDPIYNTKEKTYLIELQKETPIIYIPDKVTIDEETKEIRTITTKNIYLKGTIEETLDTITITKYHKKHQKDNNFDIIITYELNKYKEHLLSIGIIKGGTHE